MPRRAKVIKREVVPDPKYKNLTVARLITRVMNRGKRSTAEHIVYVALDIIEKEMKQDPVSSLEQAVKNITPALEVKPRRVGGATYQVPVEVRQARGISLAMRWLIKAAQARAGKSMAEKLAAEVMDAAQKQGAAIKKREDTHRMAEANRAFVHYRW